MRYFKYFNISELFSNSCSSDEIIKCVSSPCIDSLLILLEVLDGFRDYVECPIIITSSFRSPEHNSRVGGVPTSQHLCGQAIDFVVSGMHIDFVKLKLSDFFKISALKQYVGQVIIYNTFVHIGLRTDTHKNLVFYDKRTNQKSY